MEIVQGFFTYIDYLFQVIRYALRLDPQLYGFVNATPESRWLVFGVVFLAGASTLLGQSVVLFANRVRRGRFVMSLVFNGIVFIVSYFVWGLTIAVIGQLLFPDELSVWGVVRMVGLSTAPLIFGFFILIPWMGPFIGKILNIWSFLILVSVVQFGFQVDLVRALIVVGIGWLIMIVLNNLIGRPIVALRNRLWHMVAGTSLDADTQDLLLQFSKSGDAPALLRGGK